MAVTAWEMQGYPTERAAPDGFSATRRLIIPWSDRREAYAVIMDHPGHLYPYLVNCRARSVRASMEPIGRIDGLNPAEPSLADYLWGILTIEYETPRFGDVQPYPEFKSPVLYADPEASIGETLDFSVEAMTLDHNLYEWSTGENRALNAQEAPFIPRVRQEYKVIRTQQSSIPPEVLTLPGKINDAIITPVQLNPDATPTFTYAIHTLLCMSPQIAYSIDPVGAMRFDITWPMIYREETWRKFWRGDIGDFDTIRRKIDGTLFEFPEEADFAPIFPA